MMAMRLLNSMLLCGQMGAHLRSGEYRIEDHYRNCSCFTGEKEILASPRHLIVAGKDSSVSIIENALSLQLSSRVIVNFHADIFVGENSKVQFYRLQNDCKNASLILQ